MGWGISRWTSSNGFCNFGAHIVIMISTIVTWHNVAIYGSVWTYSLWGMRTANPLHTLLLVPHSTLRIHVWILSLILDKLRIFSTGYISLLLGSIIGSSTFYWLWIILSVFFESYYGLINHRVICLLFPCELRWQPMNMSLRLLPLLDILYGCVVVFFIVLPWNQHWRVVSLWLIVFLRVCHWKWCLTAGNTVYEFWIELVLLDLRCYLIDELLCLSVRRCLSIK